MMGSNLHEKLGLDIVSVTCKSRPTQLPLSSIEKITQVICGDYHTLALTDKGQIWGWGGTWHKKQISKTQKPSLLRVLSKVRFVQIDCGDFHSMALSDGGILFSWGGGGRDFNHGQTGHNTKDDVEHPTPILFFKNKPILQFKCGGYHNLAISTDGEVFSWGKGTFGQLGHSSFDDERVPRRIEALNSQSIEQIGCGLNHTCLLTS